VTPKKVNARKLAEQLAAAQARQAKKQDSPFLNLMRDVQVGLGLTGAELAAILEVTPKAFGALGTAGLPKEKQIQTLERLNLLLGQLRDTFTNAAAISNWMHNPVRYLGNRTPVEALKLQCFDTVDSAVIALQEGVYI
jgi:ribonuclease D